MLAVAKLKFAFVECRDDFALARQANELCLAAERALAEERRMAMV